MKTISLKIDDHIFEATEAILKVNKKRRNRYINEAIAFYNKHVEREALEEQLRRESYLCRESSLEVLREFEAIDDEIPE